MTTTDSFGELIDRTRQNLLDLSLRNRLINTPRSQSRTTRLEIVEESSDELFRLLARENKTLTFLPGKEIEESPDTDSNESSVESSTRLEQPGDGSAESVAARQRDSQLQTRLTSPQLQDRLLSLYYDARTFEEEQGVSILYLALGFLEWYEADAPDKPRFAPLVLIPVELHRQSAASRFRLKFREADLETNLSLQAKLRADFGIDLPEISDEENFKPTSYFTAVGNVISDQSNWKVHQNDVVLWFFSFEKYLMYRDLDHTTWPAHSTLDTNESLRRLLVDGFEGSSPLCDDTDLLDPLIPVEEMTHVTDADSSQAVAIEEVRRGRSLVIQGPPGTGKSQTITNIIATAVRSGKTVLFVAEKMAALEVVKSRLDRVGLGSICLELHSHNANKKSVLDELNRTLELGRPRTTDAAEQNQSLSTVRENLNRHAKLMNTVWQPAGVTPFQMIGELVKYKSESETPVTLLLDHPERWTKSEFEERQRQLGDFENFVDELGDISSHPWRGVRRTTPILPSELQQLLRRVRELPQKFDELIELTHALCTALRLPPATEPTLASIKRLTELGQICVGHPELDRKAIVDPIWQMQPAKIERLVEAGLILTASRKIVNGRAADAAWTTDLTEIRHGLVSYGRCWLWFLYPSYWRALDQLRGLVKGPLPAQLDEQLAFIEAIIAGQGALQTIREWNDSIGLAAFGVLWKSDKSDFEALDRIVKWVQKGRERLVDQPFREVAAGIAEIPPVQQALDAVESLWSASDSEWKSICEILQFDTHVGFRHQERRDVPLHDISSRFTEWLTKSESLSKWIAYQNHKAATESRGLQPLVQEFERGKIKHHDLVPQFSHAYYESILADVLAKSPELAAFHGATHERQVERFQALDVERMTLARNEVAATHFAKIPRESSLGEMAIIRGEIAKKRMHRPIRQLLKDAGHAVQSIKPVFMMSPMSVARFLEPGMLAFDLLVVDEASQVTPEDALGAIARAKQIVVVGDSRQLPPSRFFSKLMEDDGDDPDGAIVPSQLDSVLGLCVARGVPQRMLRWHYRSRHHSLIAVSNREFYDNQLCVIPSPSAVRHGLGLQFRPVKHGQFDRGGTATNRAEAGAIADAVIEHARTNPTKSLGVAAFSVAQRDAIRNELESRLRANPDLEEFFSTNRTERFFVKNLENVQGDERDFIFISVGYAPDASGSMAMNFGPLGMDGGERRLNVLISRAKEACIVFSSITADQIDLTRARSRGAAALKSFLYFAQTGQLDRDQGSDESAQPEFHQQVYQSLIQAGLDVEQNVGMPGFTVDLAVVDHEQPDHYLLGIEFDGPNYSRGRWARDRDRLRGSALRDRGWNLHRVWSTDWFHRPDEQLDRILKAVESAKSEEALEPEQVTQPTDAPAELIARETVDETADQSNDATSAPYVEANFAVPSEVPISDLPEETLRQAIIDVVKAEGPVHDDEVARRIVTLWKLQRLSPSTAKRIEAAIRTTINTGRLEREMESFVRLPAQPVTVRSRLQVASAGLRKVEMIPPSEISESIRSLVTANTGITRDQLYSAVAKSLGLKIVSPKLKTVIEACLTDLESNSVVEIRDEKCYLASNPHELTNSNPVGTSLSSDEGRGQGSGEKHLE